MSLVVMIRNKQRVEIIDEDTKEIVGEAYRADVTSDWFVGVKLPRIDITSRPATAMFVVGQISKELPEVVQRKVILAILKEVSGCCGVM